MPSKDELNSLLATTGWTLLGEGSYNKAYLSNIPLTINGYTTRWVKKEPIVAQPASDISRAIKKWHEINPHLPAYIVDHAWIAPFVGRTPSSDKATADAVLRIYRHSRNIILDASSSGNFIIGDDGIATCVDVDLAHRRGSYVTSLSDVPEAHKKLDTYLDHCYDLKPHTTSVILILRQIEKNSPADKIDEYLTPEVFSNILNKFRFLRVANLKLSDAGFQLLLQIVTFDTDNEISNDKLLSIINPGGFVREEPLAKLMHLAAEWGLVSLIKNLLAHHPALSNINNIDNVTPLTKTIVSKSPLENKEAIVSYLIAAGANVNIQQPWGSSPHCHDMTALDFAIQYKLIRIVDLLKKAGALTREELQAKAAASVVLTHLVTESGRVTADAAIAGTSSTSSAAAPVSEERSTDATGAPIGLKKIPASGATLELGVALRNGSIFKPEGPTPSKDEISAILATTRWSRIGEGRYKDVHLSETPLTINGQAIRWVKKARKALTNKVSDSERAIRKWNAINPDYPVYEGANGIWITPYLGDTPAPDHLVAAAVLDIYRRTRNIIIDACGKKNFLFVEGEAVCTGVDLARRRGSIVSDDARNWPTKESLDEYFNSWRNNQKSPKPLTTAVIQALLYLEKYIPANKIKNKFLTSETMAKLHICWVNDIKLSTKLIKAAIKLSDADFPTFIDKLKTIQRANVELRRARLQLLIRIVQFDTHNEIPDNQLLIFLEAGWFRDNPIADIMHLAAELGLLQLAQTLLAHDPTLLNIKDTHNITPLYRAIKSKTTIGNRENLVNYLIAKGADVNMQMKWEENPRSHHLTALDFALNYRFTNIVALLRAAGALTRGELQTSEAAESTRVSAPVMEASNAMAVGAFNTGKALAPDGSTAVDGAPLRVSSPESAAIIITAETPTISPTMPITLPKESESRAPAPVLEQSAALQHLGLFKVDAIKPSSAKDLLSLKPM